MNKQIEQKIVYLDTFKDIEKEETKQVVHDYVYDEDEINPDIVYEYKKSKNPDRISQFLLKPMYYRVKNKQLIKELLVNFKPRMRYDLNVHDIQFFGDTGLYNIIVGIDVSYVCNKDVILETIRTILPGLTNMEIIDDGDTFVRYNFYKDGELVLEYQLELEDEVYYNHFQ